jgi:hypothetical protein
MNAATARPATASNAKRWPVRSPWSSASLVAAIAATRRDWASWAWRMSLPCSAARAPSSAAVASAAWRAIRSVSGRARAALVPVSRFSARVPT